MQIKLAQRYYHIDIRLPQIKAVANIICRQECEEIDIVIHACGKVCFYTHFREQFDCT